MKNRVFIKLSYLLIVLLVASVLHSCKKDVLLDDYSGLRMFTPTTVARIISGESNVKIEWKPSIFVEEEIINYKIEVARDSSFSNIEYTTQVDTAGVTINFPDLLIRQRYVARIKSLGINGREDSKWLITQPFSIVGAQIFTSATTTGDAAELRWTFRNGLTKLTITPEVGAAYDINLTVNDKDPQNANLGFKLLSGLPSLAGFRAEIFAGSLSLGTIEFRTKAPVGTGAIIDLTGITNRPSVLSDTLRSAIPAGSTIILKKGQQYTIATTISLDRTVTIVSEDNFNPGRAEIFFTSNFNFAPGATIDSIKFKNITLRSDNPTSRYVFNTTQAANIDKMIFDECLITSFRGIFRQQSAASVVKLFSINNSIVTDIGNYGLISVDNIACTTQNISVTNSTIYKADRIIVSRSNSNSVVISNCTFNEAPVAASYIVDYSTSPTNVVANGIKLNNNIFGLGRLAGTSTEIRGIRTSTTTAILDASTSFFTSDLTFNVANPNPGFTAYSKPSTDLFTNPAAGDFKIKDATFVGRNTSGDPRWRIN
ncbi:DUF5123 domain-containing protein [Pedobacter glucosidilyticus]|uniref:DUF5123 domain-containing protein n=1 Tax=Pedobacter glucosidilyticus TaxID=1122941 RepID=UPI0026EAB9F1|nr:DUF5123 domain-containing protein [Pedobacter glucosidilyticus]